MTLFSVSDHLLGDAIFFYLFLIWACLKIRNWGVRSGFHWGKCLKFVYTRTILSLLRPFFTQPHIYFPINGMDQGNIITIRFESFP